MSLSPSWQVFAIPQPQKGTGMSPTGLARLAFWARNMTVIRDGRMEWPGFTYSDAEWARMDVLASAVPIPAYRSYVLVNAAIFIAIAALGMFGVFLPLATWLFPVPAKTGALAFSLLLAACCLLIIGIGLPISLSAAAWLCTGDTMRAALAGDASDDALAGKVSWQINRITLAMCGLLVPGMLLFITYDIDAGPLLTALKWAAILLMVISALTGARRRGKR